MRARSTLFVLAALALVAGCSRGADEPKPFRLDPTREWPDLRSVAAVAGARRIDGVTKTEVRSDLSSLPRQRSGALGPARGAGDQLALLSHFGVALCQLPPLAEKSFRELWKEGI